MRHISQNFLLGFFFVFIFTPSLKGQTAEKDKVMKVIYSIFEGMATNNGQPVAEAFTSDAITFTVFTDDDGKVQKRQGSVERFVEAVNSEKDQQWTEPVWNEKVEIDGPLASVWVDYAFYLGSTFHHCGVDAFHLIQTEEGWKIFHLVDTRRTEGCEVPEEVKAKYN